MLVLGFALIVVWFAVRYWLKRRKFYRRNASGLQEFKSYEHSVLTRIGETAALFVAGCCLIAGVILIIYHYGHTTPPAPTETPLKKHHSIH